jgi:hypothetical protein
MHEQAILPILHIVWEYTASFSMSTFIVGDWTFEALPCRALEAEEQALADARQAGKRAVWNHREFAVEYVPVTAVLKIGEVHVDYLFDNADDAKAVESIADPRGFFEHLYLHVVFALAGVQPSLSQVCTERLHMCDAVVFLAMG